MNRNPCILSRDGSIKLIRWWTVDAAEAAQTEWMGGPVPAGSTLVISRCEWLKADRPEHRAFAVTALMPDELLNDPAFDIDTALVENAVGMPEQLAKGAPS